METGQMREGGRERADERARTRGKPEGARGLCWRAVRYHVAKALEHCLRRVKRKSIKHEPEMNPRHSIKCQYRTQRRNKVKHNVRREKR